MTSFSSYHSFIAGIIYFHTLVWTRSGILFLRFYWGVFECMRTMSACWIGLMKLMRMDAALALFWIVHYANPLMTTMDKLCLESMVLNSLKKYFLHNLLYCASCFCNGLVVMMILQDLNWSRAISDSCWMSKDGINYGRLWLLVYLLANQWTTGVRRLIKDLSRRERSELERTQSKIGSVNIIVS